MSLFVRHAPGAPAQQVYNGEAIAIGLGEARPYLGEVTIHLDPSHNALRDAGCDLILRCPSRAAADHLAKAFNEARHMRDPILQQEPAPAVAAE